MDILEQSKTLYRSPDSGLTDRFKLAVDEINDGSDVLEIGVGWGELAGHLASHKKVNLYAVDAGESALEKIKSFVKDSQLADISREKIKFKDNQFDIVVCLEVFEHLQNPYHALSEIQRVLKPGGKLLLSVPNDLGGHIVIYPGLIKPKFFRLFLRQNFFRVIKEHYWGPVWNKDNVGELLKSKIGDNGMAGFLLKLVQAGIKFLQFTARLLGVRAASLYWCYFFVCENKKDQADKPFWLRQLEQTSELGARHPGWYHSYFHRKA